jgi:hypothetical protein
LGSPIPEPNSLWKIKFDDKELATYNDTSVKLQHIRSSDKCLGIYNINGCKSPSNNHTEGNELKVICFILFLNPK